MPELTSQPTRKRFGLFQWLVALLALMALLGAALLAVGASPPYNAPWTPPLRDVVVLESDLL